MDNQFYEIAAQVIPTLLIALALEGGIRSASRIGDWILGISGVLAFISELVCVSILRGSAKPTEIWETVVHYGMMILFIMAVTPLILHGPLRRRQAEHE